MEIKIIYPALQKTVAVKNLNTSLENQSNVFASTLLLDMIPLIESAFSVYVVWVLLLIGLVHVEADYLNIQAFFMVLLAKRMILLLNFLKLKKIQVSIIHKLT